jgi:homoserine O-acetyltransferase
MKMNMQRLGMLAVVTLALTAARAGAQQESAATWPAPQEGDFVVHDLHFQSGEAMPEARIHYATLGKPTKDASGRTTNAVLILHGTGGSGRQFLQPIFAGVLFGPGQLLDATKYFIILPDNVGHGKSSKPSDGLRARFPQYEYADMVALQHELVEKGLGVNHLRLVLGTSMGCMHSWLWGETYPDQMDALMPLACLPVQIAGRNRLWRKMVIDGIRQDPDWKNGDYRSQPRAALATAAEFSVDRRKLSISHARAAADARCCRQVS